MLPLSHDGAYDVQMKRRSPCPVACALDLLGDRWTLLVLRDLFLGKRLFKEFLASPEGIATNILTTRLKTLLAEGLLEQRNGGYYLTSRGETLGPVLLAVREWGLKQIEGTVDRLTAG